MKLFFILIIFIIFLIFIIVRDYQIKKKKLKLNNALNSNFFIQTINKLIDENKYNLLEERIRLREIDAYGNEDYKKWIGNPPLCLLYTSPSPRDLSTSRMPTSA